MAALAGQGCRYDHMVGHKLLSLGVAVLAFWVCGVSGDAGVSEAGSVLGEMEGWCEAGVMEVAQVQEWAGSVGVSGAVLGSVGVTGVLVGAGCMGGVVQGVQGLGLVVLGGLILVCVLHGLSKVGAKVAALAGRVGSTASAVFSGLSSSASKATN